MPLFQSTVVSKYLKSQDKIKLVEKWELYKSHFLNPVIQENIRNSKEEQYQEGFLRDLFVKILGYTLNPEHNFNLTTELKNVKDSKKADGGIIINEKVIGVVELKGTNTTDLGKVEEQAFGYKNNQSECIYVITSNFEKLRFYIDNAIEHIEFNLFTLTEPDFQLLYLCLAFENININIPKRLKEESLSQEELITKQLYKDYSLFKRELFQNLCELNPPFEPLELFKKSQKLLDRCLFLLFSEDRNLLPPNSVRLILKQWKQLHELDAYSPLYDRFKKYFGYLNTGFKGKQYDVFAYNGGLFKPDAVLDTITIDDDLLYRHTYKLSEYDFQSEVDVNILGHIFENSLNELDEVSAQLEGLTIDKSNTKRKKDGVFYTPKYITKYIVENTIGKLCEEKKAELDITDEAYQPAKQRSRKRLDNLNFYRNWLLQLTICDPACGSGAFLNQALDFLINEHRYIDELSAKYNKDAFILSDVEKSILENNLFGVDLNEESVEIAKLSLWLRTAQPNRKLNDLSGNIKCGNSLIDDASVAGEKAFNWEKEFPQIFEKGGFDVVIGNPPYLRVQGLKEHYFDLTQYYETAYKSATGNYDIYALFMEKAFSLINKNGLVSFILPHKFLISDFGVGIRTFFKEKLAVSKIIHFGSELVFQDATTYTCIINLSKEEKQNIDFIHLRPDQLFDRNDFSNISYSGLNSEQWILTSNRIGEILNKIELQPLKLKDVFERFVQGIITGKDAVFCIKGEYQGEFLNIVDEFGNTHQIERGILKPHLRGEDVKKFKSLENNEWLIFPYTIKNQKAELISPDEFEKNYPNTLNYLKLYEKILKYRENGKFNNEYWYQYSRNQAISILEQIKIITPEVCFGGSMTLDECNFYHNSKCHTLLLKDNTGYTYKSILPLINNTLFWFYLSNSGNILRGGYIGVKRKVLEPFSIPDPNSINSVKLESFTDTMLSLNKIFQEVSGKFQRGLKREFEQIDKLSKKLENWYELTYAEFLKELKKKKIELSLSQKAEWEDYFLSEQKKAVEIQNQITSTDKEIDAMVYELYGLNEEEIAIVENS